jgi:hypothetical protein
MISRLRVLCIVVWALLAAPGACAATTDALSAIDACTENLQGEDRVAVRCPQLAQALKANDWAAWLPAEWQDQYEDLSARSLAALRMSVARELALRTSRNAPPLALLRPILANLESRNERAPRTWWERLRNWLRGLAEPSPAADGESHWYARLIGHAQLSAVLLRWLAYATLALVVTLAAWIVFAEWRAARSGHVGTARDDSAAPRSPVTCSDVHWQDIEAAPSEERLRILFALIIARLTAARRLPGAGALTVRQLARLAELADVDDRERLAEVAFAAERERFAKEAPSSATLAHALARGRELLESLGEPLADPNSYRALT